MSNDLAPNPNKSTVVIPMSPEVREYISRLDAANVKAGRDLSVAITTALRAGGYSGSGSFMGMSPEGLVVQETHKVEPAPEAESQND